MLFVGLLLAYTFVYAGLSYVWQGVTMVPGASKTPSPTANNTQTV